MANYQGEGGLAWLLARAVEGMVGPWRPGAPSPARRFNQFLASQGQEGQAVPGDVPETRQPYDPTQPEAIKLPLGGLDLNNSFTNIGGLDFSGLEAAVKAGDRDITERLTEAEAAYKQALEARQSAFGTMVEGASLPTPEPAAGGEFAARLAGNVSQAVAPQMGGQGQAEQTIQQRRQSLQRMQAMRLELMGKNYDQLASEAEKAGDTAASLKNQKLAFSTGSKLQVEMAKLREQGDVMRARMTSSGARDQNIQRISMLMATHKENLDASNGRLQKLEGDTKNFNRNRSRIMAERRHNANLSAQMQLMSQSLFTGEIDPQVFSGVDVGEKIARKEIADVKARGGTLRDALRIIANDPDKDENWEFGKYGLTKGQFKKLVIDLWDKVK